MAPKPEIKAPLFHLSRATYYTDFFFYPAIIVTALTVSFLYNGSRGLSLWISIWILSCFSWTLIEYIIHRGVLHHVSYFRQMHDLHHANPTALVGTPIWISASALVLAFLALWSVTNSIPVSTAVMTGITTGYFWYVTIHHAMHHWTIRDDSILYRTKRRHAQHHYRDPSRNFGVTIGLWDHLFSRLSTRPPDGSRGWRDWLRSFRPS